MVIRPKKQKQCLPKKIAVGDRWIVSALANSSGLILAARIRKHTNKLIEDLIVSTEGKTYCKQWNSINWGGYERLLPAEILYYIGKDKIQRLERTNGIVRQQTGSWLPTAEQVGQVVGADKSNNTISGELLQLDLEA